jgi:hypothetical protein
MQGQCEGKVCGRWFTYIGLQESGSSGDQPIFGAGKHYGGFKDTGVTRMVT